MTSPNLVVKTDEERSHANHKLSLLEDLEFSL